MNKNTRTYKSLRNMIYGVGVQIITLIISFISRTIFIKILGAEYLGINGLFNNILSVLSLAELGFGQAIIYTMYKPLAENDENKITALMNFYKKIYNIIAVTIFLLGIVIVPIIQCLVKTNLDISQVKQYYILFLLNTVMSYVLSYKTSILNADQKQYVQKIYNLLGTIIQFALQTAIILITHNYILYLVMQIIGTLINNLILSIKVDKMYPYIKNEAELSKIEKKNIYSNTISLFLYKTSGVILNNTDNILISMMIGTVWVGYYSNYFMIINAINAFLTIIFYATTGSVGNLNTENNSIKQCKLYETMLLFSGWIYGTCSIVLLFVFNDFIQIWVGNEYVLSNAVVIAIVLNFYMQGILTPAWIFRDTTGLFKQTRYLAMITAIINLVLSIILGKIFGLFGILIATAISRLLTNFWYEPYILYKNIFKQKFSKFLKKQLLFVIIYVLSYIIIYLIVKNIMTISLINICIKAIIAFLVSTIIFLLFFSKDEDLKKLLEKIRIKLE